MTASYPGTIKTFSTKAPGQAIASSHINELQDEVVAIETQLGVNAGTWQSWTPTIVYTGGTTDYSITVDHSRYVKIGKTVTVAASLSVTTGTGDRLVIYLSLPIRPRNFEAGHAVENCTSSTHNIRSCRTNPETSRIEIHLPEKFNKDGIIFVKTTYEIL